MAAFHTRLREFREARGLSTRELARRLDTSGATITRLETGGQTVSVEWLEKIGRVLSVPASAFLDDSVMFATLRGDLRRNRKEWHPFSPDETKLIPVPDLSGIKLNGPSIDAFRVEDHKIIFCDRAQHFGPETIGRPYVLRIHNDDGEHLCLADFYDEEDVSAPVFLYRQGYAAQARLSLWDITLRYKWRVLGSWETFPPREP